MFGGRLWSLTSSFQDTTLGNANFETVGPIPSGSLLLGVNVHASYTGVDERGVLYLGIANNDTAGNEAFNASKSFRTNSNPTNASAQRGLALFFPTGQFFNSFFPIGIVVDSGPVFIIFGLEGDSGAQGGVLCTAWIWTMDRVGGAPGSGDGTVLDQLRRAAADGL